MNSKKIGLLSAIVLFVVISCDKQIALAPEEVILNAGAGKFGISHMKGMDQQGLSKRTSSSEVKQGIGARFDLGAIKGSTSFFFLLYNIGSKPITNISLSIPNTSFSVYPSKMDTLMPGDDVGMLPVVKVNAFHGTQLDGIGSRPLMAKGVNTAVLQIKGATKTAAGIDTVITFEVDMNLNALVLDIEMKGPNGAIDLTRSIGYGPCFLPGYSTMVPYYQNPGCDVTIKNNGNVPISLQVSYVYMKLGFANPLISGISFFTVKIDSELVIPRNNTDIIVKIDGSNTVFNSDKLVSLPNGQCCLAVRSDPENCDMELDTTLYVPLFVDYIYYLSKRLSNVTNRMFVIDSTYVFWVFQHDENDSRWTERFLYLKEPANEVASSRKEGESESGVDCKEPKYCELFNTILANLSDPKLGLGIGHTVEEITIK